MSWTWYSPMFLVDSEENVYTREKVIRKSILNDSQLAG